MDCGSECAKIISCTSKVKTAKDWFEILSNLHNLAHLGRQTKKQACLKCRQGAIKVVVNALEQDLDQYLHVSAILKRAALETLSALGQIGDHNLVNRAVDLLCHETWSIRCGAISLLTAVASSDPRHVQRVIDVSKIDLDPEVRRTAVRHVGLILTAKRSQNETEKLWKVLLMALDDEEPSVRLEARSALCACMDRDQVPLDLIAGLSCHSRKTIREFSAEVLGGRCEGRDEIVLVSEKIFSQMRDPNLSFSLRGEAADVLYTLGLRKDYPWTHEILAEIHAFRARHSSLIIRRNAISDFKRLENLDALNSVTRTVIMGCLVDAILDSDSMVRRDAIVCVERVSMQDEPTVLSRLFDLLHEETHEEVIKAAVLCFGTLAKSSYPTVKTTLEGLADHPSTTVQRAVRNTFTILDNELECLVERIRVGSLADVLFSLRQLSTKYCKRGTSFVKHKCWDDNEGKDGDCVLNVIRHRLKLDFSVDDIRLRAQLISKAGLFAQDENAWSELEAVTECGLQVCDAFTMNVIRRSSSTFLRSMTVIVMNAHAFCVEDKFDDEGILRAQYTLDEDEQKAVTAILDALKSDNEYVQLSCVKALGEIACKGNSNVLDALLEFQGGRSCRLTTGKYFAIRAIAQVSSPGSCASLQAIYRELGCEDTNILGTAIWAVGQLIIDGVEISDAGLGLNLKQRLKELCLNPQEQIRKISQWILRRMDSAISPALAQAAELSCGLQQESLINSCSVREDAAECQARKVSKFVTEFSMESMTRRLSAISYLSNCDDLNSDELSSVLVRALDDKRPEVRRYVIQVIWQKASQGNAILCNALLSRLDNQDADTAALSIKAIGRVATRGDSIVVSKLVQQIYNKCSQRPSTKIATIISAAFEALSGLVEIGDQKLITLALNCTRIDSLLIQEAAITALIRGTHPGDTQTLTCLVHMMENGVVERRMSVLDWIANAGVVENHKVMLCLRNVAKNDKSILVRSKASSILCLSQKRFTEMA